jgi:hypothetical protein
MSTSYPPNVSIVRYLIKVEIFLYFTNAVSADLDAQLHQLPGD